MNIHNIVVLWNGIFAAIAVGMALGNPFFENKKLLKLTAIPLVVCAILSTLLVGEIV